MIFARLARGLLALAAPLLLVGCVLTPGKFVSTLTINADRSFAFSYQGEVIALDPTKGLGALGKTDTPAEIDAPNLLQLGESDKNDKSTVIEASDDSSDKEAKNRAIAETLAKEYGYRSVTYLGKGKFKIDYAIRGTLTHNFAYPMNRDAEVIFPFLMIELRQNGSARVSAPGFANDSEGDKSGMGAMGGGGSPGSQLDGLFTLDTDAEIISQNNEDGPVPAGKRRTISWRATPLTKDAPSAVLRFAPAAR